MKIKHPRRAEILDMLGQRCREAEINYYRLELIDDPAKGWDARFDAASGNAPYELQFMQIVDRVRSQFS